jgi:hypothetical protein
MTPEQLENELQRVTDLVDDVLFDERLGGPFVVVDVGAIVAEGVVVRVLLGLDDVVLGLIVRVAQRVSAIRALGVVWKLSQFFIVHPKLLGGLPCGQPM